MRTDTATGGTIAALWAAAAGDTARARGQLALLRGLPADQRGNLDTALVLGEAWLAGAAGRTAAVIELLRPVVESGAHNFNPPVNQLMRWTLARAALEELARGR